MTYATDLAGRTCTLACGDRVDAARKMTPWRPGGKLTPLAESEGVIIVEDWAEIRRLHRSEGLGIKTIARRLGVARNTVRAALAAHEPDALGRMSPDDCGIARGADLH